MALTTDELTKELTVALISRVTPSTSMGDPQAASKWVAEAYKIIHKAVQEGYKIEV